MSANHFQPTADTPVTLVASEQFPFIHELGFVFLEAAGGQARIALDVEHRHTNSLDSAHGGAIMTMLDVLMGQAAISAVPDARGAVTIEMQASFMQPAGPAGTRIFAIGKVLHRGASTVFCEGEVHSATGKLAAKGSGTFKVRRAKPGE